MAGIGRITLPNGQTISIAEYTVDSLYSAMIIEADKLMSVQYELFGYGQAQEVTESRQVATRVHTNVPRAGYVGLPVGWEFYVYRWSLKTHLRIDEPIMDWAAETTVELHYNDQIKSTRPAIDLLMAPQDFFILEPPSDDENGRPGSVLPLWMRENIGYGVWVRTTERANVRLQEFLMEHTRGHKMILWVYLDGILRKNVR